MTKLDHAVLVAVEVAGETSSKHGSEFSFAIQRNQIIEAADRGSIDHDLWNCHAAGAFSHLTSIEADIDLFYVVASLGKEALCSHAVRACLSGVHLDVCHVRYRTCMDTVVPEKLAASISRVRAQCDAAARVSGRSAGAVSLLAATKYVDASVIAMLVEAGIDGIAENRLDALEAKQCEAASITRSQWHYIGRLQSRKAGDIAPRVGMIHTLCSASAAARLDTWAQQYADQMLPQLLVQVNAADDPAKDGLVFGAVDAFLDALPERIIIAGFMTMPAFSEDPEQSRDAFSQLRELRDSLQLRYGQRHPLSYLSMGTSQDWQVAVEEGATHVRLGRVLFT